MGEFTFLLFALDQIVGGIRKEGRLVIIGYHSPGIDLFGLEYSQPYPGNQLQLSFMETAWEMNGLEKDKKEHGIISQPVLEVTLKCNLEKEY